MSQIQKYNPSDGAMPVVDIGNGETVSAAEFFAKVQQCAPLALSDQRWMYLAKMAFVENRPDALMLAKQQAQQIQRGQLVGNDGAGMMLHHPPQPAPTFPSTYAHPAPYQPAQPQPIVFAPQIQVRPTIAPTFTNSPTQSTRSEQSNSHSRRNDRGGYYLDDTHPFVICCWFLLSLVAAFIFLVAA